MESEKWKVERCDASGGTRLRHSYCPGVDQSAHAIAVRGGLQYPLSIASCESNQLSLGSIHQGIFNGGNHMLIKIAAYSFSVITLLAVAFHFALALGMPWAELSWGGKYSGRLPAPMRVASVASALVLVLSALVVMIRAGLLLPRWHSLSQKVISPRRRAPAALASGGEAPRVVAHS